MGPMRLAKRLASSLLVVSVAVLDIDQFAPIL